MFGMAHDEFGHAFAGIGTQQRGACGLDVMDDREGTFKLGARFGTAFAEAGLELFLRHVPKQGALPRIVSVHRECPIVMFVYDARHLAHRHPGLQADLFDRRHGGGKVIDEIGMEFDQETHHQLLGFEAEMHFGPPVDCIAAVKSGGCFGKPYQIAGEIHDALHLALVVDPPLGHMPPCPLQK